MQFLTDGQTVQDLNIFGKGADGSVYGLFNHLHTRGGAALMEQLFREPLSRPETIRKRIAVIRYFAGEGFHFPCKPEWLDTIEQYLSDTDERTRLSGENGARGIAGLLSPANERAIIYKGIAAMVELVHACLEFLRGMAVDGTPYTEERASMLDLLADPVFTLLLEQPQRKAALTKAAEIDDLLRYRHRAVVRRLLERIYYLDVYLTVGRIATERKLAFPSVLERGAYGISIRGLFHPGLADAVSNTIRTTPDNNIVFLTGANMAGKSTFMKSFGIAIYLGHMGFPVPAEQMEFPVLDGLFTTINLADSLGSGASHFYAEVLRLKKVAGELSRGKHLLVIFDELFRGTNVKDAYEATVAVTEAFAGKRTSIFIISTHIIEAGQELRERCDNIDFLFLPTSMQEDRPVYTYQLKSGITDDRHGMVIIRNEGILEILEKGNMNA